MLNFNVCASTIYWAYNIWLKKLQLCVKFETSMVLCSKFWLIKKYRDDRRVWTACLNLLYALQLPDPLDYKATTLVNYTACKRLTVHTLP